MVEAEGEIVEPTMDMAKELCSYGDCQFHPIAGFMGGIASGEAIKLLTH